MDGDSSPCLSVYLVWSNFCQDGKWLEGFGLDQRKQLSIVVGVQNLVQTFDMVDNGTNQKAKL